MIDNLLFLKIFLKQNFCIPQKKFYFTLHILFITEVFVFNLLPHIIKSTKSDELLNRKHLIIV